MEYLSKCSFFYCLKSYLKMSLKYFCIIFRIACEILNFNWMAGLIDKVSLNPLRYEWCFQKFICLKAILCWGNRKIQKSFVYSHMHSRARGKTEMKSNAHRTFKTVWRNSQTNIGTQSDKRWYLEEKEFKNRNWWRHRQTGR